MFSVFVRARIIMTDTKLKNVQHVDPVTRELTMNALATIADTMMVVIVRTARSNNVKLALDFSTAFCDANGQLVAQGASIPIHLGAVMPALEGILSRHARDVSPGDVFICNDPYRGGSHLPDIMLCKPIFATEELLGYLTVVAHHVDIGGRVAGGNASDNTDIFQEGLRIPPLKLISRGSRDESLMSLIEANVRVPQTVRGDLEAQLAAIRLGEKELQRLADERGVNALKASIEDILDYTEALTRKEFESLPDGTARFVDYVDDDGITDDPIAIQVAVHKSGGSVTVDFEGTSPQCRSSINCTMATTKSSVYAAIRALVGSHVPSNAGYFRCIEVRAPEGSYLNAAFPGAVASRAVAGIRARQAVLGALARLMPGQIPACWGGGDVAVTMSGHGNDGQPFILVDFHNVSGTGAGEGRDGVDGGQHPLMNTANNPVEIIEAENPILIDEYQFLPNTGGRGEYRGALGIVRQYRILADSATVQIRTDRRKYPPYGLEGGEPGSPCLVFLNPDREMELLPSKCLLELKRNDVIRVEMAGSGGYGDAELRSGEAIIRDALDGKVTEW